MSYIIQRNATLRLFRVGFPPEIRSRFSVVAACLLLLACSGSDPVALELNGIPSRQISGSVGQEFRIELQTIGPGSYASPPNIEGTAVFSPA